MSSIVLDSGTLNTRVGFAGEQIPKIIEPTILGSGLGENSNETYFGSAAQTGPESLLLSNPIQEGVVTNWDDLERLWGNILSNQLGVEPRDHNILVLVSPSLDRPSRERVAEIMLESFNVKGLYLGNSAVTTLYSTGRMEGVVLEAGDGVIHAVPVHQGYAIQKSVSRWAFGGSGHTQYLGKLLTEVGYNLSLEQAALREIKENLCYVAQDFKQEMAKSSDLGFRKKYKLSDGRVVTLGSEMFKSSEILFQPSLGGMSTGGVTAVLSEAISKCTSDQQQAIAKNIVLGGGATLTRGFAERLTQEMKVVAGDDVDVVAMPHRLHSAWIGGSILAKMDQFQSMWVTSDEYTEKGVAVVQEKCK